MDKSFVDEYNEFKVRPAKNGCRCKVCDHELNGDLVVYLRSCRLAGQSYHICVSCWRKLNKIVEEELSNYNL